MYKYPIIFILAMFMNYAGNANNLQIGPVTLSNASGNYYLNFTISWENSWRVTSPPGNRDAVWVFVKRRDCAALQWRHANLAPQDSAHSAGSPLFVDAYADRKGVMIYRSADGTGNISNVNVQLKLDSVPVGSYDYQVFGIEMVYVPQGAFYLGDGVSFGGFQAGLSPTPYLVTSESLINISQAANDLWSFNLGAGPVGVLPAAYPKGFNSFYCMKYEISQGQYADFLNTLTQDAAANRYDPGYTGINRYTISGTWPALTATAPNRACNWLTFKDLAAYFDWSALSPMTELEFEKVCRGGNAAVGGECAWGGTLATDADSVIAGTDGLPNEACGNFINTGTGLSNFGNDNILGPLRCGFAASTATNRFQAGASYYGVMELSGNLYELCYNVYFQPTYSSAFLFDGSHGDGNLSTSPAAGFANQGWPVENGPSQSPHEFFSVTAKGGAWVSQAVIYLNVSDRSYPVYSASVQTLDLNSRANSFGGRGVSRR
jgi:formylglycine-generating enzyme required for sulfatase activity